MDSKALIPTLVLLIVYPDSAAYAVAAVAVMVGHVWPVWWRFEGGRGQAVLLGASVAIHVVAHPSRHSVWGRSKGCFSSPRCTWRETCGRFR